MMKMDGRDCIECQNCEKKDMIGIKGKDLNDNKTKQQIVFFFIKPKAKNMNGKKRCSGQTWSHPRERTSDFSLEYRAIRLSAVFGTRRETALRGEGFAWVPDLRSFHKLREVGVSPYMCFTLCL